MKSYSFPPIEDSYAKLLILGTMPGKTSLDVNEYYAYKHNTFWKIMFDIFNTDRSDSYNRKKNLLISNYIALWDTLKFCYREGSLDSKIKEEEPNEFNLFFKTHTNLKFIIFNGRSSFKYFEKYIGLNDKFDYHTLPSTSPANASKSYKQKLSEWMIIRKLLHTENI